MTQEALRNDPEYYALIGAARPNKNWKLIYFPYYAKGVVSGNKTGFKPINLKVPELLASSRGHQLIQITVSLDDKDHRGCTLVVLGFHRNIAEWWGQVKKCGEVRDGCLARINPLM